jgi:hypothetical protein
MKYRKLRIAFSAICIIVCVLLLVLWVRSYGRVDQAQCKISNTSVFVVVSMLGGLFFSTMETVDDSIVSSFYTDKISSEEERITLSYWQLSLIGPTKFVGVPHWFLATVCGVISILPWLRWRFSLRTLLIAMTLVAAVLGLLVYANRN